MKTETIRFALLPILPILAITTSAQASPSADIELDPLAYALGGSSVHAGIHEGRFRLDLGAFSLDLPEAFHGNKDFAVSMAGAGIKLDYFPLERSTGFFVGAEAATTKTTVIEERSKQAEQSRHFIASARIGYRIDLGQALFVSPWVSVGYATGRDIEIAGRNFEHSHLTIFPTVHLGYRFR
jgi:hypothetical protein